MDVSFDYKKWNTICFCFYWTQSTSYIKWLWVWQLFWPTFGFRLESNCSDVCFTHILFCFNAYNDPFRIYIYIILHECFNYFSAGEEWTESPETYESSFYKRTLDNEIYIFTAPYFNSRLTDPFYIVCVSIFSVVWHKAYPCLLSLWTSIQLCWQQSDRRGLSDTPLSLIHLCLLALIPTLSLALHSPSSPLISLADGRSGLSLSSVVILNYTNTCVLAVNR